MLVKRTANIESEILSRLSAGESLRSICRDDHLPDESSVRQWVLDDLDFAPRYARARGIGLDAQAEGTIDIADDMSIPADQKRYMIDARKWFASKLRPDKYGDKITTAITGADGGPLQIEIDIQLAKAALAAQLDATLSNDPAE